MQLVRGVFNECIQAGEILSLDEAFRAKVAAAGGGAPPNAESKQE